MTFGTFIYRWRWVVVAAWAVCAAAFFVFGPQAKPSEQVSFLPADAPISKATAAMAQSFRGSGALSEAVVVFERNDSGAAGLTDADKAAINRFAVDFKKTLTPNITQKELAGVSVLSPSNLDSPSLPFDNKPIAPNPLLSKDSKAALVIVSVPANFITTESSRMVKHIRQVLDEGKFPAGLDHAVTGSSGYGEDYALAAKRSHDRTVVVTLIAVIVILLLVYRSPAAALVPLVSISVAALVAISLLAIASYWGLAVGTAEMIFVVVLLYGTGVDYTLLYISRYRELLVEGLAPDRAAAEALDRTRGAIIAAALTDTAGLLMLVFAQYAIFKTTGQAVAIALMLAMLASLTLAPAMVAILGRRIFWPSGSGDKQLGLSFGHRRIWPVIARIVTTRPALVIVATLAAAAAPAWTGSHLTWSYDTLSGLDAGVYEAPRGFKMASKHWSAGEVAPMTVMVRYDKPLDVSMWHDVADKITRAASAQPHVSNIRSFSQPMGNETGAIGTIALWMSPRVTNEYLSPDRRACRMTVILDSQALSREALSTAGPVRDAVSQAANAALGQDKMKPCEVFISGATAEMLDIRAITQSDFRLIVILSLGVVFLIITVLLRDPILTAFMVASTIVSYLATLGITHWFFTFVMGTSGLDWKVEVFLFVVMVAVGQDYNIFLATRLRQEAQTKSPLAAIAGAVTHTGPVISSCGIIMAATLGSLAAGDLTLVRQLGFALSLGMLIDTFIVRPLLLPSFAAITKRTGFRNQTTAKIT